MLNFAQKSKVQSGLNKIDVRIDIFQAIIKGYLSEMKNELSEIEKRSIVYTGKFMI